MLSALVFLPLFLGSALPSVATAEEFDYSKGPKGPWNWGNIKAEWKMCKAGRSQSPIDIRLDELRPFCALRLLQVRYRAVNATLTSSDHYIGLAFGENAGTLTIDGVIYNLSEYHIHLPSEHSINGVRYAAERHLVHRAPDGKIAVISVLYSIGEEEEEEEEYEEEEVYLMSKGSWQEYGTMRNIKWVDHVAVPPRRRELWGGAVSAKQQYLPQWEKVSEMCGLDEKPSSSRDVFIDEAEQLLSAIGSGGEMHTGLVDPSKLNVGGKTFYRYVGSLTTPPCSEGVTWNILRRPRKLSTKQFQLLKDALNGDNARPLQAANGRVVSYYERKRFKPA